MEFTINIQAHELATAIQALASALSNKKETEFERIANQGVEALQQAPSPFMHPVNQLAYESLQTAVIAPAEQIQQPVPTAVPTAPIQQPVQQPYQQAPIQQPQTVPTSAPVYTMDQLAVAATQLMDAGKRNELLQLLTAFGVQALTALPKEQYGAFATKLREMGANV